MNYWLGQSLRWAKYQNEYMRTWEEVIILTGTSENELDTGCDFIRQR